MCIGIIYATCQNSRAMPAVIRAGFAPDVAVLNCYQWFAQGMYATEAVYEKGLVNQGTAIKTKKISQVGHGYPESRPVASQVWNSFDVSSRQIKDRTNIAVMERHPYTTQTFIPLARSADQPQYLVVIADDLDGRPNVRTIRAYICHGAQAGKYLTSLLAVVDLHMLVTYAVNQWHSPMIALSEPIKFLVTNGENGSADDCEEHYFPESEQPVVLVDLMQKKIASQAKL